MILRDEAERAIRAWDAYERKRGTSAVIDYDCYPHGAAVQPAASRLEVLHALEDLWQRLGDRELPELRRRLRSDLTYLRALLGERLPLNDYVEQTQGCSALGWSDDYLMQRRELMRDRLTAIGVGWNAQTATELAQVETPLNVEDVPDVVRQMMTDLEPAVRRITGSTAPFELSIENVHIDAYWSYWLDGAGQNARMRLNLKNAVFTEVSARAFTLHEIFGHALQGASFSAQALTEDVPWVRLCSVHAAQQVLMEGLAQALPLFVIPDDQRAMARLSFVHYTQLARADLHRLVNAGASIDDCVTRARFLVPSWTDENIGNILSDRAVNPQLRSYLWAYPAGLDWFTALAESESEVIGSVLQACYRKPLAPEELSQLWADGPQFGGKRSE
ncbi:hypothetical protein [Actinoplanes sp. NPDC023714]|uniref:hypothetical protein n=1 Tax=Actinoplanes sp. NPDC023714 TaxID=3154322 RepID=UPI0033C0B20D